MFCVDVIVRQETTEKSHEKFIPWNTHDLFCKNGPVVSGQIKGYKFDIPFLTNKPGFDITIFFPEQTLRSSKL